MFEKFSTQSRSAWIDKADQETKTLPISFPFIFTIEDLTLESINTREDLPPTVSQKYSQDNNRDRPLISGWIPELDEIENKAWIANALKQGAEDLFIASPFSVAPDFDALFDGQTSSLRSLAFRCPVDRIEKLISTLRSKQAEQQEKLLVTLYTSPIEELLANKTVSVFGNDMALLSQCITKFPSTRMLGVEGEVFGNYGATVTQELAYALSYTAYLWDQLSDRGVDLNILINHTEIALSIGNEFYTDLTKFRAMRVLLYYLLDAYAVTDANPYRIPLRAITSSFNKTLYDPDGNLLRNTTEALAATLGGAQIITLRSHDLHYLKNSGFGQRMALNIQHLLRHEAHLHQVHNPVEGSYFLERTTQQLVEKAWQAFVEVEGEGGVVAYAANGRLQSLLQSSVAEKRREILTQAKTAVGVSRYTNPAQQISEKDVNVSAFRNNCTLPIEQIRLRVDQCNSTEKPNFLIVTPTSASEKHEVINRITYISDILTSLGLPSSQHEDPPTLIQVIQGTIPLAGVVFCTDDSWYQTQLKYRLQELESLELKKIAVGKIPLLYSLKTEGLLDDVLFPNTDITDFLRTIESLLPHEA